MEATVWLQLVVIVVLGALNLCAAENLVPGGDFTEAKKGKIDWCRREGGATGAFVLAVALVPGVREMKPVEGMYSLRAAMPCPWYDWTDYDTVGQCLAKANCVETRDASLPPEGYSLKVAPGRIEIASSDEAGAFYARETLKQLTAKVSTDSVEIACCEIRDWPRYRWRGLLIDEARHFLGKNVVMRVLDQMAQHKLNVLHWHLVDDQGWRLEIKSHPELVKYGSVRPRSVKMGTHARWLPPDKKLSFEYDTETYGPYFYSHDDVREILAYARVRHITVVPEIELPGHVRALLAAHPELSCRGDLERIPRVAWSIEKDVLCVGNDAAIRLLEEVFDEVCELFPDTPYIHIGGDECPRDRWKECPKCQARMRALGLKDESGLQSWITSHFVGYIERKGRRAVGWDEVLAGDVPTSTVGMTWRMSAKGGAMTHFVSAPEAVGRGHDMVMTPSACCYLSKRQFASGDPYPYYGVRLGSPLTIEKVYAFDPCAGIPEEGRRYIIGGQACVWGESVFNVFDFEWKTWPRGCALAEVLWLGESKPAYEDFLGRMRAHRARLIEQGVNCAPLE